MRPRQSSLGINASAGANPANKEGFNEAEAIKPRNREPTKSAALTKLPCFNEAEAIKPRNQPAPAPAPVQHEVLQ